jgi:AraC-type DNA-binding domain-containing proteins
MSEVVLENGQEWLVLARDGRFCAAELARVLKVSLRQLERAFVQDTDWSPQEWLNHTRLWYACSLLLQGQRPKEIYYDLGFQSSTGFFHAFKSYHGWTTREFMLYHDEQESSGIDRLKQSSGICASLISINGTPQHVVALEVLNKALLKSQRCKLYMIRSGCRRKAVSVGI